MYLPTPYKAGQPQYNTGCLNTNNAVKHNFLGAAVCTCCILLRITFLAKAAQHRQSTMHQLISLVFCSSEITDKNTLFFKWALPFSRATLAALEVSITHPQRSISRFICIGRQKLQCESSIILIWLHATASKTTAHQRHMSVCHDSVPADTTCFRANPVT